MEITRMLIEITANDGDNSTALRKALDRIAANGGGRLRLLPGLHLSSSLRLPSGLSLEIPEGAILKALPALDAMDAVQSPVPSRMDVVPWRAFLYAIGARNLTIRGNGTIDGSGDAACFQDGIENSPNRPYGLHLIDCRTIHIHGITLRNSGFWMQRYFACRDLHIAGISVFNHANKNNDGLDIDSCEHVRVDDCRIDSSDDALCIKSEGAQPARDIRIRNCTLSTHASAFKLGTGSVGGFDDITASGLRIVPSAATTMHHPLALPGGLSGIDLATVDGGSMRRIRIEDVEMEGLQNPIFLRLGMRGSRSVARQGYGGGEDERQGVAAGADDGVDRSASIGRIEDIHLGQICGRNLGPHPVILCGLPGHPMRRISMKSIELSFSRAGSVQDLIPPADWNDSGYPMALMFGSQLPAYGLVTRFVHDLRLQKIALHAAPGEPRPERYRAPEPH
jgi:hypothetical protein